MNKIITFLLLASLGMAGCQKKISDTIDGQTPDQRLSVALAAYQKQLTQSANGWILIENTTGVAINAGTPTNGPIAIFAYYMQFNDSNKVTMFSDFDTTTALTPKTSSYRVKALQRPALIFDTYSYIHLPCDPDPAISKSPFGPGLGWGTDFEFSFADNTDPSSLGDTIHLLGNLNSSNAIMVKATKAQHDAYFNGTFAKDFIFAKIQNYFKNLTVGLKTYQITPGISNHAIDISWLTGVTPHTVSTPFYQLADGIGFGTPVVANGQTLTGIQNIVFDPNTSTATVKINGVAGTLVGAIAPLSYDPNVTGDWYFAAYNAHGLYISPNGFHIDGVDDALRLDTLTIIMDSAQAPVPYNTLVYFPNEFGSFTDLFSPFFADQAQAGYPSYFSAAIITAINPTAGFVDFPQDVTPQSITDTYNLIQDPNGFYFILKEDGLTYDMVIASDAKTWLTWNFIP